jgi:hypothetical protein
MCVLQTLQATILLADGCCAVVFTGFLNFFNKKNPTNTNKATKINLFSP